jgi:hypothetical protein
MANWNLKRLEAKLDKAREQRDRLLGAINKLMATADQPIGEDELRAVLDDPQADENARSQAAAFLELFSAIAFAEDR